jgi:hypothetical protein
MKNKIRIILFCLFTITSFAQKKTIIKEKQVSASVQKGTTQNSSICGLCKGTGKDPRCYGSGLCQNHHSIYLDKECFKNCNCYDGGEDIGDEPETSEECTVRCKKECERSQICDNCDSYDGTCKKMWCNNGVCRNCNGKGKVFK